MVGIPIVPSYPHSTHCEYSGEHFSTLGSPIWEGGIAAGENSGYSVPFHLARLSFSLSHILSLSLTLSLSLARSLARQHRRQFHVTVTSGPSQAQLSEHLKTWLVQRRWGRSRSGRVVSHQVTSPTSERDRERETWRRSEQVTSPSSQQVTSPSSERERPGVGACQRCSHLVHAQGMLGTVACRSHSNLISQLEAQGLCKTCIKSSKEEEEAFPARCCREWGVSRPTLTLHPAPLTPQPFRLRVEG